MAGGEGVRGVRGRDRAGGAGRGQLRSPERNRSFSASQQRGGLGVSLPRAQHPPWLLHVRVCVTPLPHAGH